MDQKILNKGITIQEISIKTVKSGSKYALKDHEGRTFNFFTTKQDGTDTQAYTQFKNMGLKVGSTVTIGYVEDSFTTQDGRTGITKKIISFRELSGDSSQVPAEAESGRREANRAFQEPSSNDTYGRRLAIHGFVNGMLAAGGKVEIIAKDLPSLLWLEDTIEKALNKTRPVQPIDVENIPTIQQDEDFDSLAESVPF